jgi:hypothetical protein
MSFPLMVVAALIVMMGEFGESMVDAEMVVILQEAERRKQEG